MNGAPEVMASGLVKEKASRHQHTLLYKLETLVNPSSNSNCYQEYLQSAGQVFYQKDQGNSWWELSIELSVWEVNKILEFWPFESIAEAGKTGAAGMVHWLDQSGWVQKLLRRCVLWIKSSKFPITKRWSCWEDAFYESNRPSFKKQSENLGRFCSPNIASLFGCAMDEKNCSIIMELIGGDLLYLTQERLHTFSYSRSKLCTWI